MFSAADAARALDEAHRTRARFQNLPEAIAPKTVEEAYDVQEALCKLWEPRFDCLTAPRASARRNSPVASY